MSSSSSSDSDSSSSYDDDSSQDMLELLTKDKFKGAHVIANLQAGFKKCHGDFDEAIFEISMIQLFSHLFHSLLATTKKTTATSRDYIQIYFTYQEKGENDRYIYWITDFCESNGLRFDRIGFAQQTQYANGIDAVELLHKFKKNDSKSAPTYIPRDYCDEYRMSVREDIETMYRESRAKDVKVKASLKNYETLEKRIEQLETQLKNSSAVESKVDIEKSKDEKSSDEKPADE